MIESEVILGKCEDIMKGYPDGFFDLAIVDPPYGINAPNMRMGTHPKRSRQDGFGSGPGVSTTSKMKTLFNHGGGTLKDRNLNKASFNWDDEPPSPEYFQELFRISKNQIIWGGNYFDLPPTRCIICWDKLQPWDNFSQWEMAWTSFNKPAKKYAISNTGGSNTEGKIHPTQKPVKLYDRLFADFSEPGMKILDTHLGSGSSRISAYKFQLYFRGIEINQKYLDDSKHRFNEFKRQTVLQF
tara:strand:+ start:581 stop:1303 length:723 start_codon:yes stop_codon:yes gene_type:complete